MFHDMSSSAKSSQLFACAAVKSLCINGSVQPTTALEILEHCMGVTSLAIWILPDTEVSTIPVLMQEYVSALPLRKLSLNMASIFCSPSPSFAMLDIAHMIAHLKILEGWVLLLELKT